MNGRMTKEARAMELARFAICDFQEQVGAVIKALAMVTVKSGPGGDDMIFGTAEEDFGEDE